MIRYFTDNLQAQRAHYGPPQVEVVMAADHDKAMEKAEAGHRQLLADLNKRYNDLFMVVCLVIQEHGNGQLVLTKRALEDFDSDRAVLNIRHDHERSDATVLTVTTRPEYVKQDDDDRPPDNGGDQGGVGTDQGGAESGGEGGSAGGGD